MTFAFVRPRHRPESRIFAEPPADDLQALILRAADRLEPQMRRAFLAAVGRVESEIVLSRLADAIGRGDAQGALAESRVQRFLMELDAELPGLKAEMAQQVIQATASVAPAAGAISAATYGYSFDLVNPMAVRWARAHSSRFFPLIANRSEQAVRAIITEALSTGMDPREAARRISMVVGLTEQDAQAWNRYRDGLIEAGRTSAQVERLTGRYGRRLLRERGTTIARTETIAAASEGQRLLWDDLMWQGLLDRDAWERRWIVAPTRPCPLCKALNGTSAPVNGTFAAGLSGPPRHPRCRCTTALYRKREAA